VLSIEQCRELLGVDAVGKTDEEIAELRDRMRQLGAVVISIIRKREGGATR
jgi:hypothetical protein